MPSPLITIITPSFNRAGMIRDAIKSVLRQDYQPFEHIIIDGASTDGTLDILHEYAHLRIISEPDQGMYDAINKGLRQASGEIIGLLNSDDWYSPGAFQTVAGAFATHADALAIVGGAQIHSATSGGHRLVRERPPIQPDEFWYRVIQGPPVTNAWFFRPQVFQRVGLMNSSYQFAADREFLIRAALAGIRPIPVDSVLYLYRQHAESATIGSQDSRDPRRGAQRLLVIGEAMRLLEGFLQQKGLPHEARHYLISAHSIACYRATATALYHRRFRPAFDAVKLGFQYDRFWPLVFIRHSWHRVLQEFGIREPD